jgi:hypothetical protein
MGCEMNPLNLLESVCSGMALCHNHATSLEEEQTTKVVLHTLVETYNRVKIGSASILTIEEHDIDRTLSVVLKFNMEFA